MKIDCNQFENAVYWTGVRMCVCVCICAIMNKRQLLIMYTDWAICCQGRLSDMSDRGSLPVLQQ